MGAVQTGIILFIVFFMAMGIVSLSLRLFGKDFTSRGAFLENSYWYGKEKLSEKLEDQMKQF
jgi:hypothetical protein